MSQAPDPSHPIDRRPYKGPQPSCHDVNMMTRTKDMLEILVGFTGGQIQLMDPLKHECLKCFNEEVSASHFTIVTFVITIVTLS